MTEFQYQPIFEHQGAEETSYRQLDSSGVSTENLGDTEILRVDPEAHSLLAREALLDISHLLRTSHLEQLRRVFDDPESSENDQSDDPIEIGRTPRSRTERSCG